MAVGVRCPFKSKTAMPILKANMLSHVMNMCVQLRFKPKQRVWASARAPGRNHFAYKVNLPLSCPITVPDALPPPLTIGAGIFSARSVAPICHPSPNVFLHHAQ
eukprot:355021-Chlamydomonas_euryale.AAC.5